MLKKRSRTSAARRRRAENSPVGIAVAKANMRRIMVDIGIHIFMKDDGEPAAKLLAHLGWMLAIGAQVQVRIDVAAAKPLHAALRTVLQLSVAGNRWSAAQAPYLHHAAELAKAVMLAHPIQGLEVQRDAEFISYHIGHGTATMDMVAGAEIYNQQESTV